MEENLVTSCLSTVLLFLLIFLHVVVIRDCLTPLYYICGFHSVPISVQYVLYSSPILRHIVSSKLLMSTD